MRRHHALLKVSSLVPENADLHVESVDINALANELYAQSFTLSPHTFSLDVITADTLDQFAPDLLMLSPPCQPYTKTVNGNRRDDQDPRARSMVVLTQCLTKMTLPPRYIIMENVEGFVGSNVHVNLLKSLYDCGYSLEQFLISPHQLGIPYFRARFFLLASKTAKSMNDRQGYVLDIDSSASAMTRHPPTLTNEAMAVLGVLPKSDCNPWAPASFPGSSDIRPITLECTPLGSYLDVIALDSKEWQRHAIPREVLSKFYKCYDLVTPSSRHCNCITKNYSINHRGAGSILIATPMDHMDSSTKSCVEQDDRGRLFFTSDPSDTPLYPHLRYLTPNEISRLHGLPSPHGHLLSAMSSSKTAINLLGNSLSVDVFAWLLAHLLTKA